LSRDVQQTGAAWSAATRTVTVVGDLVQRTGDGRTGRIPRGRAVERGWRRVRSAPDTWRLEARISWLSLKTKVVKGFPVWASKPAALVW
jgi:hypothetical protein